MRLDPVLHPLERAVSKHMHSVFEPAIRKGDLLARMDVLFLTHEFTLVVLYGLTICVLDKVIVEVELAAFLSVVRRHDSSELHVFKAGHCSARCSRDWTFYEPDQIWSWYS